jgi:nitroreductase
MLKSTNRVLELATSRKSVRKFSKKSVSMQDVLYALEAARLAPSGANEQPWRFLIVTDSDIKRKIKKASERGEQQFYENVGGKFREWLLSQGLSHEKPFLEEAPLLIIVFVKRNAKYARESVWVALGFIILALEEVSLGTVIYTPSNREFILEEIDVPQGFSLEAILPIGYSKDEKPKTSRFELRKIAFHDHWGNKIESRLSRARAIDTYFYK